MLAKVLIILGIAVVILAMWLLPSKEYQKEPEVSQEKTKPIELGYADIKVIEETTEEEEIVVADNSPIVFERAAVDSEVMEKLHEETENSYENSFRSEFNKNLGDGGGTHGGWPDGNSDAHLDWENSNSGRPGTLGDGKPWPPALPKGRDDLNLKREFPDLYPQRQFAPKPMAAKPDTRDMGEGEGEETLPGNRASPDVIKLPQKTNREAYANFHDNPFKNVADGEHTSTFSIDVDTAGYSNLRRQIHQHHLPQVNAIRIEEMINYFNYPYPAPSIDAEHPFSHAITSSICPWQPKHRLVRVALQGKTFTNSDRPASNLVFLIDVSGSMNTRNKLPLVKSSLKLLVKQLDERDRVSLVTYAGNAALVLPSTSGDQHNVIIQAIDALNAGGSTHGSGGISAAYEQAQKGFIKGGANRVFLTTDGDFNVGITDSTALTNLIRENASNGIYLNALGFGTGNYQDARMEQISNEGNGFYAYVDGAAEAHKLFKEEFTAQLVTIAKDVKIQIFWNPAKVAAYRLIGYENRVMAAKDFDDDRKDAGDIGSGHNVTALYEVVPAGLAVPGTATPNPFVTPPKPEAPAEPIDDTHDLMLRLRYKEPEGDTSTLQELKIALDPIPFENQDESFRWAAAVAGGGMVLRHSPHRGDADWDKVIAWAKGARGADPEGRRAEFITLMRNAQGLAPH